jgi:glutamate decarboxylase
LGLLDDRRMPIHSTKASDESEPVTPTVSESVLASYQLALGQPAPKEKFPQVPVDPDVAKNMISAELMLDGNARLNLATFVTTWMEPQADALMAECFDKNMIDKDEYPQTAELERRCVAMLGDLWHAQESGVGCSTTGSSEACMLGALALKRRWQKRRRDAGEPADKPNLILGINAQICWDKFCNFFEVEPKFVMMEGDRFTLGVEEAVALCDENTIGVVAILGSTFDGAYEDVAGLSKALDDLQESTGLDIPIHVDGASGAMVAPFIDPSLEWDFQVPRVVSINTSGHKYGRVYPGVGWIVWGTQEALPDELVFHVNYLGGDMPTFALNFSRPGSQVVAQYYNFVRLGREGYAAMQQAARDAATRLSSEIEQRPEFRLITRGDELPVFAFTTAEDVTTFDVYDVSRRLRERGWQVPAYSFPKNREDLSVLRVVVRNGNVDLLEMLLDDIDRLLPELRSQSAPLDSSQKQTFHH